VLATGGFQSNLDMVREYWASGVPFPENFLSGSGINSTGTGHKVASAAGAALVDMDRQMNLSSGIRDPRYPDRRRGLNAGNRDAIWINQLGHRFIDESLSPEITLNTIVQQPGSTYWAVFDAAARESFRVSGSDWISFEHIDALILRNPDLTKVAPTLDQLAQITGLPADALRKTVTDFNRSVVSGRDPEFNRFERGHGYTPPQILRPPFYAVQFFPLTRKSMGGVAIDLSCRVLDTKGEIIPGLFAIGELTGSAGINGESGMAGMFLGPCIVTGRVAARTVLQGLPANVAPPVHEFRPEVLVRSKSVDTQNCLTCHALPVLTAQSRQGYWHFEKVHRRVVTGAQDCAGCHSELSPTYQPAGHRINPTALAQACVKCHSGEN
jgi:succinate dehydrogenase/fumarate reductase flavoprotein subunit